MKTTKLYLFLAIMLWLLCCPSHAQKSITVTGQIVDEQTGKPVPYATVGAALKPMIQTILHTAIADEEGRFECTIGEGNYLIHFSSIGYKPTSRSCSTLDGKNEPISLGQIKMLPLPSIWQRLSSNPLSTCRLPKSSTTSRKIPTGKR